MTEKSKAKKTQPNGLEVYRRNTKVESERWGWRLWSQGRKVATSGEGYTDKAEAEDMAASVLSGRYWNAVSDLLDGGK